MSVTPGDTKGKVRLVLDFGNTTVDQAKAVAHNIKGNLRTLLVGFQVIGDSCEVVEDSRDDLVARLTEAYNREHAERLHMARCPECVCAQCERIRKEASRG